MTLLTSCMMNVLMPLEKLVRRLFTQQNLNLRTMNLFKKKESFQVTAEFYAR
jgi:hypothetical protein